MKVKEVGVIVVKSHKGSIEPCTNEGCCLKGHVLILDVSLTFSNGKKWVKDKEYVKGVGEFETYEAAHKEMKWVHDQLQMYLEDEKPKEQPSVCYCLGPNAADCPVHNKVFRKCACCKFRCHPCSAGCDGMWKK